MALSLDPITGLPVDYLAPDLYQIPLNSRPQLAPEWSPDHLPPNALHPDNMPSMFATVQAQNSLNPELPQACTTDGAGNLNVNVRAGGGGGGGGSLPLPTIVSGSELPDNGTNSDNWLFSANWASLTKIYRMDFYAELIADPGTAHRGVIFFGLVKDGSSFPDWYAWTLYVGNGLSGLTTGLPSASLSVDFGGGLDVGVYLRTGVPGCYVYFNNKCSPLRAGCTIYGS